MLRKKFPGCTIKGRQLLSEMKKRQIRFKLIQIKKSVPEASLEVRQTQFNDSK